jgi:quinol monooxygenase YgiN
VIKPYKAEEFFKSVSSFARKIRKDKGCIAYDIYRNSEKKNTFSLDGKWGTRPAMAKHFKTQNFEVLIGATRVLGETFEMNIAEVFETGALNWLKNRSQRNKGGAQWRIEHFLKPLIVKEIEKMINLKTVTVIAVVAFLASSVAANAADKPKYATEMPVGITAPDEATIEKVFDNLDFQRGVQAILTAM